MNAPPHASLQPRLRSTTLVVIQVLALSLLWWLADWLSHAFLPGVPGSVLGMALLLAALASGLVKPNWLAAGTAWLLGELLLFFIPAVIAIVDYGDFVRLYGLALVAIIVFSTLAVMAATALAVEFTVRRFGQQDEEPET